eukprot:CAMPEP_0119144964 /NCGR_PEP_ID=MMETSP1310-20130426/36787_1 /TAXON_ID=464262 /ORGANISM="Genus nov. species nov., Strain RCC2339" /LENGTH=227 /DNA_ID=CAMNT_0007136747 /DNA_START=116 /DNA_END=796 /DNA_ORIENTATION=-
MEQVRNNGDPTALSILYSNRAACYIATKDTTRAVRDATECVRLRPQWEKGYARLGDACCLDGQYDKALSAYHEGLYCNPDSSYFGKKIKKCQSKIKGLLLREAYATLGETYGRWEHGGKSKFYITEQREDMGKGMFAATPIDAGEIIFSEVPVVHVHHTHWDVCELCGKFVGSWKTHMNHVVEGGAESLPFVREAYPPTRTALECACCGLRFCKDACRAAFHCDYQR